VNQADQPTAADPYVLPLLQKPMFLAAYAARKIGDNVTASGPPHEVRGVGLRVS
jgi:hypothetical protein